MRTILIITFIATIALPLKAENDRMANLDYGFTFQPRFTAHYQFDEDREAVRYGFGIRRALLRFRYQSNDLVFFSQLGSTADGRYFMQDLSVSWHFDERWTLIGGRFNGAQPRGAGLTSHRETDLVDRILPAVRWNMIRGNDNRDFGMEIRRAGDSFEWRVFLHNGDGRYNTLTGNLRRETHQGPQEAYQDRKGLSLSSVYLYGLQENVEIGGYAGIALGEQSVLGNRRHQAFSGHFYYGDTPGSLPLRLKTEVIGWRVEDAFAAGEHAFEWALNVTGARLLRPDTELVLMFDRYSQDQGADRLTQTMVSVGGSYSLSIHRNETFHASRLVTALQYMDNGQEEHVIALIAQLQISI